MHNTGAIDVHCHYGRSVDQTCAIVDEFMSADAAEVVARAARFGVTHSIVSPLAAVFGRTAADIIAGNSDAAEQAARIDGLYHWVVAHPLLPETWEQADSMLRTPKCLGIKVHPEQHQYPIVEHGEYIFKFAAERRAVLQSHSGDPYSCPLDYVQFADRYPEVTLLISHLGHGVNGDVTQQVRAIQSCKNGNIYTDTSSSKSIYPRLHEWAVKKIGADRICFGTDSPLYHIAMQKARVDAADISEADRKKILRENAARVFRGKIESQ